MTNLELRDRVPPDPSVGGEFTESYTFLGLILAFFFAVTLTLSIVGLTHPSWLGFG